MKNKQIVVVVSFNSRVTFKMHALLSYPYVCVKYYVGKAFILIAYSGGLVTSDREGFILKSVTVFCIK